MTSERKCSAILEKLYREAEQSLTSRSVSDSVLLQKTDYVARCSTNRAAIRLLILKNRRALNCVKQYRSDFRLKEKRVYT